jgi:two-component system, chemotaxis family, chemotaxis protein CheY
MTRPGFILVVEDDANIRDVVQLALTDEGYVVETAPNGASALELAERARPDLILLDMRMPVMDGWAFARTYRERPGPHAPIVVLTASRMAAEWAAEVAAQGYVGKPFDLEEVLTAVAHHVRPPGSAR